MQYNMPRVIMWIENRSVHFYPTLDYQQLMMSPWSEYAMAHLTMLQGSDRLVNLVAWFAFLASIIGVFLVYIHADIFSAGHKGCSFLKGMSQTLKPYSKKGAPFYNVWIGSRVLGVVAGLRPSDL
jgi:hypothetical protein